jgi:hypothetical protein
MTDKVQIDFGGTSGVPASGVIVSPVASASATVPAGTELLAIVAGANMHFRVGAGAQTALLTDPMVTPGSATLIIKLDADVTYTIAAILDSGTTGTLSFFRIYEA